MEDVKYIDVDKTKLEQMQQHCICQFEQPIVAIPVEFKAPGSSNFVSGYLMITCGAHYFFKGKAFGHVSLVTKFNIYQINVIHFSSNQVIFDFSDFGMADFNKNSITESKSSVTEKAAASKSVNNNLSATSNSLIFLKTNDSFIVVQASLYIQKFVSFGVKDAHLCRLDSNSTIKEIEINKRPPYPLKYRTIFFAHYYENDPKEKIDVDYFKKWENRHRYYIIIDGSLQIGNFGRAFGHSIAWESKIKSVCFRSFSPLNFSDFFDSLITNSIASLVEVQFTDYKDPNNLPVFSGRPLKCDNCTIKRYVFQDVIGSFLLSFFEKCKKIPRIEDLILSKVKMDATEFTQFCNCVLHNVAMQKTLKKLVFEKSPIPSFPSNDMKIMLECLSHLESISISDLNCDGIRLINAVCKSNSPVKIIHANRLKFLKSFENTTFPETLAHLDVSMSIFSDEAISSLLVSITKKPVKIPIIFSACRIILKKSSYPAIGRIKFENCYPTIAEFNFSFNRIPAFGSRSLFAFLFTQKNLRNLTLNSIGATDSVKLLKNIMMIILSLKIQAFSFSPASERILAILNSVKKQEQKSEQKNDNDNDQKSESNPFKEDEQVDDLLSFDFEQPTTPVVKSSNFAEDLFSLDFNQTADSNSNMNEKNSKKKKESQKPKNSDKPPPTVSAADPSTIIQFVQALVQQNVTFLRRLALPNSSIGDKGISALLQLLQISPNLNEVMFDGIQPDSLENFILLWKVISQHPSIVACDYPEQDIKKLQFDVDKANTEIQSIFKKIKEKVQPSTTSKRLKFTINETKINFEKITIDGSIFEKCASFDEKHFDRECNADDDYEDLNENENKQENVWTNSQIGNNDNGKDDDLLVFENFE